MLNVRGLGQLPQSSYPVRYSDQIIVTQGDCAAKGGVLFDQQRLCCVKMNPVTGKPEPGRADDYGWFCAKTAFGAPPAPGAAPGSPGYYPPMQTSSMFGGGMSEYLPLAIAGGALLLLAVGRRS